MCALFVLVVANVIQSMKGNEIWDTVRRQMLGVRTCQNSCPRALVGLLASWPLNWPSFLTNHCIHLGHSNLDSFLAVSGYSTRSLEAWYKKSISTKVGLLSTAYMPKLLFECVSPGSTVSICIYNRCTTTVRYICVMSRKELEYTMGEEACFSCFVVCTTAASIESLDFWVDSSRR